jgi:hypothetical protein
MCPLKVVQEAALRTHTRPHITSHSVRRAAVYPPPPSSWRVQMVLFIFDSSTAGAFTYDASSIPRLDGVGRVVRHVSARAAPWKSRTHQAMNFTTRLPPFFHLPLPLIAIPASALERVLGHYWDSGVFFCASLAANLAGALEVVSSSCIKPMDQGRGFAAASKRCVENGPM